MQWVAFPLHPETPDQGQTLERMLAGRGIDIAQMLAHLKRTADGLGLPFGPRNMTFNSRKAQEIGKWADSEGRGDAFHKGVFHAYFVHGLNISQLDVLTELAVDAGLEGNAVEAVLQERRYAEAVDADWLRSRRLRITAVPTFLFNGQRLVGAQSYESLRNLISRFS
jgi:predicted DsbA family dithiol-disulfide isomerase